MRDDLESLWGEYKTQMNEHFKKALEQVNTIFNALDVDLKGKILLDVFA